MLPPRERANIPPMRIISRRTLREHWEKPGRGDSEAPPTDWFNIAGNKYRLVAGIDFRYRTVYVKWIGTHAEYDDIDVREV